ncbi:MAG: nucleotide kinase domain-containing protein [Devosia sp.]
MVYETYWRFAAERQRIFFKRLNGGVYPWSEDPILNEYKFTNVYRAADRVSQYLIKNVIYDGDQSPDAGWGRTPDRRCRQPAGTGIAHYLGRTRCAQG